MISIQFYNAFDINFMQDQIFVNSIYSLMKKELSKYQLTFDNIESPLLDEFKDAVGKYYEIMNMSGNSIETPEDGKTAARQLITDEIILIKEMLVEALKLEQGFESTDQGNNFMTAQAAAMLSTIEGTLQNTAAASIDTWNNFLRKTMFGEYEDIDDYGNVSDIITTDGPSYGFLKESEIDNDGNYVYTYSLFYIIDTTRRTSGGIEWDATKLISIQCTRENAPSNLDEVYDNLANLMFQTDEFDRVFNNISPIRTFVASLVLYQYSALSDATTFSKEPSERSLGTGLFNFMAKTKLTILQLFASSIYGGGKIDYQDPFIQKAQP